MYYYYYYYYYYDDDDDDNNDINDDDGWAHLSKSLKSFQSSTKLEALKNAAKRC